MSVLIIAEAGVNHNGDLLLAKRMIEVAALAGADVVKFQTFRSENLVTKSAVKADYQKQATGTDDSQFDMLKKLEISPSQHEELINTCLQHNIQFLSTPFDTESVDYLESIGIQSWKIPSGEITNLPYLVKIAKTEKPIILSSGMSTMQELSAAVKVLKDNGAGEITALHCNSEYPTPFEDANIKAMLTIEDELNIPMGYSDHTPGIEAAIAAVALGAVIIEKHFTLDKNMDGPDHRASLEPDELAAMVKAVRNVEKAMGTGKKIPSPSEQKNIIIARKSIVAMRKIKKGEELTVDNITTKRPGNGVSPMLWFDVLGTKACRDFEEDELIAL
jgi:N,N'-diacetyllegionaminate synthase